MPADRAPKGNSVFVQVKTTTDGRRRDWRVKLSNALRFAKNPLPCFTILLVFDKASLELSAAYLKHFWQEDIEKALAAGRKASIVGSPLNRETISVRFRNSDLTRSDQILESIRIISAGFGTQYSAEKQRLVDQAGSDSLAFNLTATFNAGILPDTLLDAMLGSVERIKIDRLRVVEERFGLSAELPDLTGPGELSFEPYKKPVELVFTRFDHAEAIRLAGHAAYATLPTETGLMRRLRVQAGFVELTTDLSGDGNISFKFHRDGRYTITQIYEIAKLSCWLSKSPVEIALDCAVGNLFRGSCDLSADSAGDFLCSLHDVLGDIFDLFPPNRWPTSITFALDDLASGWTSILEFVTFLTRPGAVWTLGDLNPAISEAQLGNAPAMQGVCFLDLEVVTLFAVYVASLEEARVTGESASLTIEKPEILRRHVLHGSARANWDFMRKETAKVRESLSAELIQSDLSETPPDGDPPNA